MRTPQPTDLPADPQLTAFERAKVRAIVGLSTDLHDRMQALSERRYSLSERLRDLKLRAVTLRQGLDRKYSDEGLEQLERHLAQQAEIEEAYLAAQSRYETMGREAQIAGGFADRLLAHLGLRADGDDVLTMDWSLPGAVRGPGATGSLPKTFGDATRGVSHG